VTVQFLGLHAVEVRTLWEEGAMRRTLTSLAAGLAAAVIAALVAVAVPAEGAPNGGGPGDPLLLSRVNQAGPMTVLKTNGGFRILAKNPKRPPLMVYSPDSMPPLDVSSQAKVANLNADLLDGMDSSAFSPAGHAHDGRYYTKAETEARYLRENGTATDSDRVDGFHANSLIRVAHDETGEVQELAKFLPPGEHSPDLLYTQIDAPTAGLLYIVAGVDSDVASGRDLFYCDLQVDDHDVLGSIRWVEATNVSTSAYLNTNSENCSTNGVVEVGAGSHTVYLRIFNRGGPSDANADFHDGSLQVLFVPFRADGTQPIATGGW
jgi:hypothetical protein